MRILAQTNSIAFPNMFDVSTNKVSVLEDNASVVNRVRLLFLTEPTELYNELNFGLGLKRYLFQYNTDNVKAHIQDRMKEQLLAYEPSVDSEKTAFADGLLFTGSQETLAEKMQSLNMTVGLQTIFGDEVEVNLNGDK